MGIYSDSDFPYYLWTTDNGTRCWAKVKVTGEEVEISREVMQELRKEQDRIKKEKAELDSQAGKNARQSYEINHPLPMEASYAELANSEWLISQDTPESQFAAFELEQQLLSTLTDRQRDCYLSCVVLGESRSEYAKRLGISTYRVSEIFNQIARKFKKL